MSQYIVVSKAAWEVIKEQQQIVFRMAHLPQWLIYQAKSKRRGQAPKSPPK